MADRFISTTGHESLEAIPVAGGVTLAAGDIAAIVYDDAIGTAELSAALELLQAKMLQQES
tara:strand:- start:41 stop:223 length:183 start_codon:yes stop_codon:yes gene_type:complete